MCNEEITFFGGETVGFAEEKGDGWKVFETKVNFLVAILIKNGYI